MSNTETNIFALICFILGLFFGFLFGGTYGQSEEKKRTCQYDKQGIWVESQCMKGEKL
jgi:hypothetical protein